MCRTWRRGVVLRDGASTLVLVLKSALSTSFKCLTDA